MKCDELKRKYSDITGPYYGCNEVDEAIDELKKKLMPCLNGDCILTCEVVEKYGKENAELKQKLEDVKASHYAEMVDAGMRERRLKRALWKLKALYFYILFQWSMTGKRFAPEDDEPEDFFMACIGKHTKRKSEWGKEADMFDNARIVCIKKAEEYKR